MEFKLMEVNINCEVEICLLGLRHDTTKPYEWKIIFYLSKHSGVYCRGEWALPRYGGSK